MPFALVFAEIADTLLFDNIMTVVKDNMKASLDEIFDSEDLPDFAQRTLGTHFKLGQYPVFALDPDEHGPQQSADGSWVEDSVKVQTYLSVESDNLPDAIRLAAKYATAFKAVLRRAERDRSFTAGFPANSVFACTVEFSYKYGIEGKTANGFEVPVNMELLFKFNQT